MRNIEGMMREEMTRRATTKPENVREQILIAVFALLAILAIIALGCVASFI